MQEGPLPPWWQEPVEWTLTQVPAAATRLLCPGDWPSLSESVSPAEQERPALPWEAILPPTCLDVKVLWWFFGGTIRIGIW